MEAVLKLVDIFKSYKTPEGGKLEILSSLSFTLYKGESSAIMGRSGSGKSTLLSVASLLLPPDSGKIYYGEKDMLSLGKKEKERMRNTDIGFVFQSSLLLDDFTAEENVCIPLLIKGMGKKEAKRRAEECLSLLSLESRAKYRPPFLSGGEKQRVAVARAISTMPSIIFADEPTGSLDEKTAALVEDALFQAVKKEGLSMLLVTHNKTLAAKADRVLTLTGGNLYE